MYEESSYRWSALLVLAQAFLIPVYFFAISLWLEEVRIFPSDINFIIQCIITPIIFSIPFLYWTIVERYELADTYERTTTQVMALPVAIRVFYFLNFVVVIAFLIPLLAPIIALAGGFMLGATYLTKNEGTIVDKLDTLPMKIYTFFLLLFCGIIGVIFYVRILLVLPAFTSFWEDNLTFVYGSAVCLADAVTIGGLFYLNYELLQQEDNTIEIPEIPILILTLVIYFIYQVVWIILYITPGAAVWMYVIHYLSAAVALLILIVRWKTGIGIERGTDLKSWFFILLFQVVNFLGTELTIPSFAIGGLETPLLHIAIFAKTTTIAIAFLIFSGLFITKYIEAHQRF